MAKFVGRELLRTLGSAFAMAVLNGSGSAGQLNGIRNTAGVQSQSGTSLDTGTFTMVRKSSEVSAPVAERITSPLVRPARDRRIPEFSTCERPVVVRGVSLIRRAAISLSCHEILNSRVMIMRSVNLQRRFDGLSDRDRRGHPVAFPTRHRRCHHDRFMCIKIASFPSHIVKWAYVI